MHDPATCMILMILVILILVVLVTGRLQIFKSKAQNLSTVGPSSRSSVRIRSIAPLSQRSSNSSSYSCMFMIHFHILDLYRFRACRHALLLDLAFCGPCKELALETSCTLRCILLDDRSVKLVARCCKFQPPLSQVKPLQLSAMMLLPPSLMPKPVPIHLPSIVLWPNIDYDLKPSGCANGTRVQS